MNNLKENDVPAIINRDQKAKIIEVKARENLNSLKSMRIISVTPMPESSKNTYDYFFRTSQKKNGSDFLNDFGNLKIPTIFQIFDRDSLELFKNRFKCTRSSSQTRKTEEKLLHKHESFLPEPLKEKTQEQLPQKQRKILII